MLLMLIIVPNKVLCKASSRTTESPLMTYGVTKSTDVTPKPFFLEADLKLIVLLNSSIAR
jgi:hypothetical protein